MTFFVALRKELLEQWRTYRLLVVAVVLLVFGLLSPLTAKFMPEMFKMLPQGEQFAALIPPPTAADAVGQYVKNSTQFAVILALLVTMGAVAVEKDKGTAALMLVKPLSRLSFLLAKFVALGVTFAVGIALAALACYYYTLLLFAALDVPAWLALNGLLLVFVLVYVALTLLSSTVSRSQVVAGGLGFGWILLLSLVGAIPQVGDVMPGALVSWGSRLVLGDAETAWPALAVSVGLIVAALAGAWIIFRRQEL